ncbi:unnamed protein product [Meganyctiphanes norvegica]|uniref:Major facilitator superfamily associated domain-containing protein n=1 Tax=Meganyctiphanes norvegica TaxID=48144 RepID=A0AAV2PN05_MEGNR
MSCKMCSINKNLLPIKLHYILRLGGWGGLSLMLPVLVRQKGVPEDLIGLMWSIAPVIGLIFNSLAGTISDYFKAHRLVFLMSIFALNAGVTSVYFMPDVPTTVTSSVHSSTNSSAAATEIDITINNSDMYPSNGEYISQIDGVLNILSNNITSEGVQNVTKSVDMGNLSVKTMKYPQFWFISFAILMTMVGNVVVVTMEDSVCFILLGTERHNYGKQRMWGTISMGIFAIIIGALVDIYSRGLPEKDYFPVIALCFTFLLVDFVFVSRMELPVKKEEKLNFSEVRQIIMDPKLLIVMMSITVSGLILGTIWAFKLIVVEDVAMAWDKNFASQKLLSGLVVGFETIGGKLPFFFFSGFIIEKLGHIVVFGIVLISLTLRCFLYSIVSNPWLFLPIEILNGPSFGLLLAVMGSYASVKAPPGAEATLQAILRGSFWLGISCAGVVAGILIQNMGSAFTFLCLGLIVGAFTVVYTLLQLIAGKGTSNQENLKSSRNDVSPAA